MAVAAPDRARRDGDLRRLRGADLRRVRLVHLSRAGRGGGAQPQCRRHRRADRRRLAHHGRDRAARRRTRQAAADQRRASHHHDQRNRAHQPALPGTCFLLRRSRSFGEQHGRQRDRDAALGEGARLYLADRRDLGLSHAAHDGGARAADARHRAGAVPGRDRQAAQRAVVGERADRAADLLRICQVRRGAIAHAHRAAGADRCARAKTRRADEKAGVQAGRACGEGRRAC